MIKMVWSLGNFNLHVIKVRSISDIIAACKTTKEARQQGFFIVKLYNRQRKIS